MIRVSALPGEPYLMRASVVATFALIALSSGCGGGASSGSTQTMISGGTGSAIVPAPQQAVQMSSTTTALSAGPQTLALPKAGDISGSVQLQTATGSSPTSLRIVATEHPALSEASLALLDLPQNNTPALTAVYSTQFSVTSSIVLEGLPDFSISAPEFSGVSPEDISYKLFDGIDCTNVVAASQRAVTVSGQTATFSANSTMTPLQAGHTYVFVFYVIGAVSTPTPHAECC